MSNSKDAAEAEWMGRAIPVLIGFVAVLILVAVGVVLWLN